MLLMLGTLGVHRAACEAVVAVVSECCDVADESAVVELFGECKHANGGTVGYASGYAVGGTIGLAAGGIVPGIGGGIASGTVFGQGTTTSDSVLVRLSKGEEVIRASEASKHRALLKQINAGQFSEGMTRGSFAPSIAAQTTVIERVHTETPTELTLVDTKGALIGTMQVVANREIDEYSNQMAKERRRAGF
ncbi:hypothetical protein [Leucobacter manosquensis]|uniref:Glycine zipper domain-containing protein n=1 Tax=Leucobacter manosquensis TaxID=2810611 RepID=A0ABS5M8Z3_9MICO|nr:hypothetical protein [Leucobacter manosquensis]MBS3183285.1 hypothetical protein [Leucobacter manosquensis]